MGVFSPVVLPLFAVVMDVGEAEFGQCCAIGFEPVGDDDGGLNRLIAKQALQELQSRIGVPLSLHYKVQHLAFVIDGAPQIHLLAPDIADHLIEMPTRGGGTVPPSQCPGELGSEFDRPAPDGLIADLDPTHRHHLLDVAKTDREAEVEPHRMADDIGREAMAIERDWSHKSLSHNGSLSRKVETL
jgi:hypothetical protein